MEGFQYWILPALLGAVWAVLWFRVPTGRRTAGWVAYFPLAFVVLILTLRIGIPIVNHFQAEPIVDPSEAERRAANPDVSDRAFDLEVNFALAGILWLILGLVTAVGEFSRFSDRRRL